MLRARILTKRLILKLVLRDNKSLRQRDINLNRSLGNLNRGLSLTNNRVNILITVQTRTRFTNGLGRRFTTRQTNRVLIVSSSLRRTNQVAGISRNRTAIVTTAIGPANRNSLLTRRNLNRFDNVVYSMDHLTRCLISPQFFTQVHRVSAIY